MDNLVGTIDPSGCPRIKVSVFGLHEGLAREFDAIVDTGFTGFLSMPMVEAFPLGLILQGTTNISLADGSTVPNLVAMGRIRCGGQEQPGLILLETNPCDILLGMDFLRTFGRVLFVHPTKQTLMLVHETVVEALVAQQASPAPSQNETPDIKTGEPAIPPGPKPA